MSKRNAEQVSEAILKAVLRKSIDEQVIGDVSAQELVGLVANNFSSCPACGGRAVDKHRLPRVRPDGFVWIRADRRT